MSDKQIMLRLSAETIGDSGPAFRTETFWIEPDGDDTPCEPDISQWMDWVGRQGEAFGRSVDDACVKRVRRMLMRADDDGAQDMGRALDMWWMAWCRVRDSLSEECERQFVQHLRAAADKAEAEMPTWQEARAEAEASE